MGIFNVIVSGMQNKLLIFGMDPGLTYLKVLSIFCTCLHIQDNTLRLPQSIIDTSVDRAVKLRIKLLVAVNQLQDENTDWLLLSGLFSHFIHLIPPSVAHSPALLCLFSAV